MITDLLVGRPFLVVVALLVLVGAGPVVGRRLVSRPRLAWSLAGLALLPVAVLTLLPVDRQLFAVCTVQWALPTPGRVELFANVVLFVAPTLLAGVATRRPAVVALAASLLSAVIEAVQALVPALGRSCDTTDWLCNTIGGLLGALLALVALRWAQVPLSRRRSP